MCCALEKQFLKQFLLGSRKHFKHWETVSTYRETFSEGFHEFGGHHSVPWANLCSSMLYEHCQAPRETCNWTLTPWGIIRVFWVILWERMSLVKRFQGYSESWGSIRVFWVIPWERMSLVKRFQGYSESWGIIRVVRVIPWETISLVKRFLGYDESWGIIRVFWVTPWETISLQGYSESWGIFETFHKMLNLLTVHFWGCIGECWWLAGAAAVWWGNSWHSLCCMRTQMKDAIF